MPPPAVVTIPEDLELHLSVLGRTLEHLGTQMYKRRDVAIAELVANAWDACSANTRITLPESGYDPANSLIEILDDGVGMTAESVQSDFLVIGRNRRKAGASSCGRPVMGKKGIGKLAGFGMARIMEITTWRDEAATFFRLDLDALKIEDGETRNMPVFGQRIPLPSWTQSATGTRILLRMLKHSTPLDLAKIRESLARRFNTRIRGEMTISVNGEPLIEPALELDKRVPDQGYIEESLAPDKTVRYYYAFTEKPIGSSELRGFTIYVRGRTAQAPPFFFDVEGTASGQHSTKYLTGAIEADYLDDAIDDAMDVISTDRQNIDWELPALAELKEWGEALSRRALRECADFKGGEMRDWILDVPEFASRVRKLDKPSEEQLRRFLVTLGRAEPEAERALELADSLIQAFEYRHFHDVVSDIESIGEDPSALEQLLSQLHDWKVLESRAILEIVRGRIGIIDRFHGMVISDAPETKSKLSADNMHDLLAGYPWLLNPEWQVLSEEKTITKQLAEWNVTETGEPDERYDFLALDDEKRLVLVEIKRSGHPVQLEELERLQRYKQRLSKGTEKKITMVLVYGGTIDVDEDIANSWRQRPDAKLITWAELHSKNKVYYEHYRSVLERDIDADTFDRKEKEVSATRAVLAGGTIHRTPAIRKAGLGPQDWIEPETPSPSGV